MSYGKRAYGAISAGGSSGYNKASRMVGGRLLSYRPSAPVMGSSRWNASMSAKGLNRRGVASRETGFVDVAPAVYALNTTGSIALLNIVPQGTSVSQRVGKKIALKSLQCRGIMANLFSATGNDVAFLIVYDKRPTGSLPAITDILVTSTAASFNNDANSGRFEILKRVDDELIGNFSAGTNLTADSYKSADFWLDLKGRPTVYKAAGTGAIGDIEQGALYLITVGNNVVAGNVAAELQVGFRMRFLDM